MELARLETRQEELDREIKEETSNLKIIEVERLDVEETREQIHKLKQQVGLIGAIDETVTTEYEEVSARYQFLSTQSQDLDEAIGHLEKVIKDLDEAISTQFDNAFKNINQLFTKYFKKLFNGGKAQLILEIKEVPIDKNEVIENPEEDEVNSEGDLADAETEHKEKTKIKPKKNMVSILSPLLPVKNYPASTCFLVAKKP